MGYEEKAAEHFTSRFTLAFAARGGDPSILACSSAELFMGKLNLTSDFLQSIAGEAVPIRPPRSNRSRFAS